MQYLISTKFEHSFLLDLKEYQQHGVFFTLDGKEVVSCKSDSSNNICFKDSEGKRLWSDDEENIIQHVPVVLGKINGIEFNYVPQDEILTKKYKDFENGEYLVVIYDMRSMSLSNGIFTRHQNLTVIDGMFGFDVEDKKKILAYIKLREL